MFVDRLGCWSGHRVGLTRVVLGQVSGSPHSWTEQPSLSRGLGLRPSVSIRPGAVRPPQPPGVLHGSRPLLGDGRSAVAWPGPARTGLAPSAGAERCGNRTPDALLGVSVAGHGSAATMEATRVTSLCTSRHRGVGQGPRKPRDVLPLGPGSGHWPVISVGKT